MEMCKKCGTFLAMAGSEYCAGCNPLGLTVQQGQVGTGEQQQAQNINASGIAVSQQQSQATGGAQQQSFIAEGESKPDKKVMKKLSKMDKRLKHIQDDVELIKEYTAQIELIFDKLDTLDDLEAFLKKKLSSDFEKITGAWKDYKAGKIGRGELIKEGIKVIGKTFVKKILGKVNPF